MNSILAGIILTSSLATPLATNCRFLSAEGKLAVSGNPSFISILVKHHGATDLSFSGEINARTKVFLNGEEINFSDLAAGTGSVTANAVICWPDEYEGELKKWFLMLNLETVQRHMISPRAQVKLGRVAEITLGSFILLCIWAYGFWGLRASIPGAALNFARLSGLLAFLIFVINRIDKADHFVPTPFIHDVNWIVLLGGALLGSIALRCIEWIGRYQKAKVLTVILLCASAPTALYCFLLMGDVSGIVLFATLGLALGICLERAFRHTN